MAEKKIKDNCIRDYAENPLFPIGGPLSQIGHGKVSPATRAAKTGAAKVPRSYLGSVGRLLLFASLSKTDSMRSLLECFDVNQPPIESSYPDIYLGFVFRPTLSNRIGQ
jgi:hypothetical protein